MNLIKVKGQGQLLKQTILLVSKASCRLVEDYMYIDVYDRLQGRCQMRL